MAQYRIDVRPILDEVGGSVSVSDTLDIEELVVGDERFAMVEPPSFNVTVSNAGEALVSIGTVTAHVRATCSRCLCEFETDITGDVEGLWARPGMGAPEGEDTSGEVDAENKIDLEPALLAALVVEAPFAPLHAEDCAGLCPTCGADLNVEECDCAKQPESDNPFAALQGLLGEAGETEGDKRE